MTEKMCRFCKVFDQNMQIDSKKLLKRPCKRCGRALANHASIHPHFLEIRDGNGKIVAHRVDVCLAYVLGKFSNAQKKQITQELDKILNA